VDASREDLRTRLRSLVQRAHRPSRQGVTSTFSPAAEPQLEPTQGDASRTLVITGAAGRLGTYLRSSLNEVATKARLVDIVAPPEALPGEPSRFYQGSVTDPICSTRCAAARMPSSTSEASPAIGPGRTSPRSTSVGPAKYWRRPDARCEAVVVASSNHACRLSRPGTPAARRRRGTAADSLYGVSKAASEAFASSTASSSRWTSSVCASGPVSTLRRTTACFPPGSRRPISCG